MNELSVKEFLVTIYKYKKPVIMITGFAAIISVVVALLLPKVYKATVVIMPPQMESGLGLSSLMGNLPLGGFGLGGEDEGVNNYLAILTSRTLNASIIRDFDLEAEYESENINEAIKGLAGNTNFVVRDEGTISITAYSEDQEKVAPLANAFAYKLDSLNNLLSNERAKNNRIFIEERLNQIMLEAEAAEDSLRAFQDRYGIIEIAVQTEESLRALAEIEAAIIKEEIELDVLLNTTVSTNQDVIQKEISIASMKNRLMAYTQGEDKGHIIKSVQSLPERAIQYGRLWREVEAKNTVLTFLLPEYEQSKIKEVKQSSTVQILDQAIRPFKKARPARTIIVLLSTMSAFALCLYGVLFYEKYFMEKSE